MATGMVKYLLKCYIMLNHCFFQTKHPVTTGDKECIVMPPPAGRALRCYLFRCGEGYPLGSPAGFGNFVYRRYRIHEYLFERNRKRLVTGMVLKYNKISHVKGSRFLKM